MSPPQACEVVGEITQRNGNGLLLLLGLSASVGCGDSQCLTGPLYQCHSVTSTSVVVLRTSAKPSTPSNVLRDKCAQVVQHE